MTNHPDFEKCPRGNQWTQALNLLFPALRKEAWASHGKWCWKVLPHGALVSVRIVPPEEGVAGLAFHTELRVARRTVPEDSKGWEAWARELKTFLVHFGGETEWEEVSASTATKAEVIYRARMKGRILQEKCAYCGQPATKGPFKEAVCESCARERGIAEVAENAAKRAGTVQRLLETGEVRDPAVPDRRKKKA